METSEQSVKYVQSLKKTTERSQQHPSRFLIVNFVQIAHIILVFPLLTLANGVQAGLMMIRELKHG